MSEDIDFSNLTTEEIFIKASEDENLILPALAELAERTKDNIAIEMIGIFGRDCGEDIAEVALDILSPLKKNERATEMIGLIGWKHGGKIAERALTELAKRKGDEATSGICVIGYTHGGEIAEMALDILAERKGPWATNMIGTIVKTIAKTDAKNISELKKKAITILHNRASSNMDGFGHIVQVEEEIIKNIPNRQIDLPPFNPEWN
ncbi:MAG: hypothetical protein OEY94_06405 [Alphaproteobacteria bacterium]|nr:hypothetical protein [Alphaproteobacteria bacterium]